MIFYSFKSTWARAFCASFLLLVSLQVFSRTEINQFEELLIKAEEQKRIDVAGFELTIAKLIQNKNQLAPLHSNHLDYLLAWKKSFDGAFSEAIPALTRQADEVKDETLKLRILSTLVNVLLLTRQYETSFKYLIEIENLLPKVSDPDAKAQALGVTAILLNQVGEFNRALNYSEIMLGTGQANWTKCVAIQIRFESLFKQKLLKVDDKNLRASIDQCKGSNDLIYAYLMNTYLVRLLIEAKDNNAALKIIENSIGEVQKTKYLRLISEYYALQAKIYLQTGNIAAAKIAALRSIENAPANEITDPKIEALRVLADASSREGSFETAFQYQARYSIAEKAYLDDVSTRQLAYQMAAHQAAAKQHEIDGLSKQNELLKLKQDLDRKAAEFNRLMAICLAVILGLILVLALKIKRSQLWFKKLSEHDALTGIVNRARFIELAESALTQARSNNSLASIAILDLDFFKQVNDQYGHLTGDVVLKNAVETVQKVLRKEDIFGRLGGEEFAVYWPNANLDAAKQLAEQIRAAIEQNTVHEQGVEIRVTTSIGVATTESLGYTLPVLLRKADLALYDAKHDGRNQVRVFQANKSTTHHRH